MTTSDTSSGWVVVETMGADRTLVFDGYKPRPFAGVSRRKTGLSSLTKPLNDLVTRIVDTANDQPVAEEHSGAGLVATPVLGPPHDPCVYAVSVWIGRATDADLSKGPRVIGTMLWDPETLLTYHSPITEVEILGNHPPVEERVSAEVFRHFQHYPKEHLLGPWVKEVMEGGVPDNDTFADEIDLERSDGELIRVYLTMRVVDYNGHHAIRGVIHDISDFNTPTGYRGLDRQTARTAMQIVAGANHEHGYAHVNFATGVILEWFVPAPPPLDVWERQNAQWDDEKVFLGNLERAMAGEQVDFPAVVRFDDGVARPVCVTIFPAHSGEEGNGVMRVTLDA